MPDLPGALDEKGWVKRFTREARPGAYLRVVREGSVSPGDAIEVVHRPDHEVTVAFWFRAFTTERELLARTLAAGDALEPGARDKALAHVEKYGKRGD